MAASAEVLSALVYLKAISLKNLVQARLRRVRQPKYLIGAVLGIAYFYFVFFGNRAGRPGQRSTPLDALSETQLPLLLVFGSIVMLVFVALCWALRRQRAALSFTEAEIAFLFPAPVGRATLIHYRLASAALAGLFTALIFTLLSRRWSGAAPDALFRLIGWWLIFSTVSLHTIGSAFVITKWQDRGLSPLQCQLIAWGTIAILVGLPLAWLWQRANLGIALDADVINHGPVAWLLYPFRLLLAPMLAPDLPAFLKAVWPAALLYAAHYWWVLRVQVGFEEASLVRAEKRSRKLEAIRTGNWRLGNSVQKARPDPFNLQRAAWPELAFLWKNLLSTREYLRLRNAVILAAIIIVGSLWLRGSPFMGAGLSLSIMFLVIGAYVLVLGPQLARQDLRSDLANTDLLKTYPLRGWQIVLGEILTPTAVLTGILWLLLLAGVMLMPNAPPRLPWLTPGARFAGAGVVALLIPLLCMMQLLVANAATVIFPAWSLNSAARGPQGIEVMGQRILFMAGQLIGLLLLLIPVVFCAVLAGAAAYWIAGDIAAIAAGLVVAMAIMAAEIVAGAWLLGGRFEQLDLSRELRP